MRVLSSILADAWQVALDIAGIVGRSVKRRREEQDQAVIPLD